MARLVFGRSRTLVKEIFESPSPVDLVFRYFNLMFFPLLSELIVNGLPSPRIFSDSIPSQNKSEQLHAFKHQRAQRPVYHFNPSFGAYGRSTNNVKVYCDGVAASTLENIKP